MEEWRQIKGFPGYEISNLGRCRSYRGRGGAKGSSSKERLNPTLLTDSLHKQGYRKFELYRDGKKKALFVHRLVALAFIPNPDDKPEVNHKNGIVWDCRVDNLEWHTRLENQHHAFRTGLVSPSHRGPNIPRQTRQLIKQMVDQGFTKSHVARKLNLDRKSVLTYSK